MHPLHAYVAKQLAGKVDARGVVVWYDERNELAQFIDELRGGPRTVGEPTSVPLGGWRVRIAEHAGSMFELRAAIEPFVNGDKPEPVGE